MASSAKRVGMITAFQRNLTELLDSIEDCLAKRRILPCLMLLYSGIDVIASLEAGTASRSAFTKWVNRYVLKSTSLSCTASDLYGARCGILHTLSAESNMSRKGTARRMGYAWGNASTDELERATKELGRDERAVHVRELIDAFRLGLTNYMQEVMQDESRKQKIFAGAGMWLTDMGQNAIKDFLKTCKP